MHNALKLNIHVSVMVHSNQRGGEVIVGHKSHILLWEQGGASQVIIIIIIIYLGPTYLVFDFRNLLK